MRKALEYIRQRGFAGCAKQFKPKSLTNTGLAFCRRLTFLLRVLCVMVWVRP